MLASAADVLATDADEAALRALGFGYRAPYVIKSARALRDDDDKGDDGMSDEEQTEFFEHMRPMLPNIARVMDEINHQEETIIGSGCDDDVEFLSLVSKSAFPLVAGFWCDLDW